MKVEIEQVKILKRHIIVDIPEQEFKDQDGLRGWEIQKMAENAIISRYADLLDKQGFMVESDDFTIDPAHCFAALTE